MSEDNISKSLLSNFKDFLESANDELSKERYNPAISSYFKAIAILCDWKIYEEMGLLPKNHSERFFILRNNFPEVHSLISPLFKEYRESYNLRMEKKDALRLKENVEKLKRLFKIDE